MKNVIECNGLVITIVCEGDEDNQETKVTVERGDELLEELVFTDEVNDDEEGEEGDDEGIKDFDSFEEEEVEGDEDEDAESIDAFDDEEGDDDGDDDDDDEVNESKLLDFDSFLSNDK